MTAVVRASADLVAALIIHVLDVEGVDVAGEVAGWVSTGFFLFWGKDEPEDCEEDVDE